MKNKLKNEKEGRGEELEQCCQNPERLTAVSVHKSQWVHMAAALLELLLKFGMR